MKVVYANEDGAVAYVQAVDAESGQHINPDTSKNPNPDISDPRCPIASAPYVDPDTGEQVFDDGQPDNATVVWNQFGPGNSWWVLLPDHPEGPQVQITAKEILPGPVDGKCYVFQGWNISYGNDLAPTPTPEPETFNLPNNSFVRVEVLYELRTITPGGGGWEAGGGVYDHDLGMLFKLLESHVFRFSDLLQGRVIAIVVEPHAATRHRVLPEKPLTRAQRREVIAAARSHKTRPESLRSLLQSLMDPGRD